MIFQYNKNQNIIYAHTSNGKRQVNQPAIQFDKYTYDIKRVGELDSILQIPTDDHIVTVDLLMSTMDPYIITLVLNASINSAMNESDITQTYETYMSELLEKVLSHTQNTSKTLQSQVAKEALKLHHHFK